MKDSIFLDSNIFLYAFSNKDLEKQKIASLLVMNDTKNLSQKVKSRNKNQDNWIEETFAVMSENESKDLLDNIYNHRVSKHFSSLKVAMH